MKYRPNDDEAACASVVAKRRRTLNGGGSNLPEETMDDHARYVLDYRSALAEIAAARMLNLCWTGCGIGSRDSERGGACDVGGFVEVRSIVDASYGLQINARDADASPMMLVLVAEDRTCHALGWQFVGYVRQHGRCMREVKPWWLLPQAQLRPMAELVDIVAWKREFASVRAA